MRLTLRVWRQAGPAARGGFQTLQANDVSEHMSFLEMLDVVNEELLAKGEEPIAFDHDCREGICGTCALMINGIPHGPQRATTTCQLHMRSFRDGDAITIEPWRAKAFPVLRDLVVDRSGFDRIIAAGGFVSAPTGSAQDANAILVSKEQRRPRHGRGGLHWVRRLCRRLPQWFGDALHRRQGRAPRHCCRRASPSAIAGCSPWSARWTPRSSAGARLFAECEAACPKEISVENIARLNRDLLRATLADRGRVAVGVGVGVIRAPAIADRGCDRIDVCRRRRGGAVVVRHHTDGPGHFRRRPFRSDSRRRLAHRGATGPAGPDGDRARLRRQDRLHRDARSRGSDDQGR